MAVARYRDPKPRALDLPSALLSLAAVLLVIYGIKVCAQDGVGPFPLLSIGAGLAMATAFGHRQNSVADPLIDLRLFRVPIFSASLGVYLLGTLVAFGSYVFIGQYLHLVLRLSPLAAGIWMLPWSAEFVVGATVAPTIGRRVRPRLVMGAGLITAAGGLAVLSRVGETGIAGLVVGATIFSLGLSPVSTLATDLIVPRERAGAAAAISETSSELGGALGIAILGSIGTAIYRRDMALSSLRGLPWWPCGAFAPTAMSRARSGDASPTNTRPSPGADPLAQAARPASVPPVARQCFIKTCRASAVAARARPYRSPWIVSDGPTAW